MANNLIQIKRTSVTGRAANTTTLPNPGELALNMTDGIMYSGNGSVVFEVGANNTNVNVSGNLTVKSIVANGAIGSTGTVLTSNGSSVYWAPGAPATTDRLVNGSYQLNVDSYGVVNVPISQFSSGQVFAPINYSLYLGTSSKFIQINGSDASIQPNSDGVANLGQPGASWNNAYFKGSVNAASFTGLSYANPNLLLPKGDDPYWAYGSDVSGSNVYMQVKFWGGGGDASRYFTIVDSSNNNELFRVDGTAAAFIKKLSANGSLGSAGQALFSNGSDVYWGSGATGYTGSQGTTGFTGSKGDQGTEGFTGSQGGTGYVGSQGTTGFTGSQGDQGTTGYTGSQGTTGYVEG